LLEAQSLLEILHPTYLKSDMIFKVHFQEIFHSEDRQEREELLKKKYISV